MKKIKLFKNSLLRNLEIYMQVKNIHKIALLLDPKKTSLKMIERQEKDEIKMLLLEEMKLHENKITYQTQPTIN